MHIHDVTSLTFQPAFRLPITGIFVGRIIASLKQDIDVTFSFFFKELEQAAAFDEACIGFDLPANDEGRSMITVRCHDVIRVEFEPQKNGVSIMVYDRKDENFASQNIQIFTAE